MLIIFKIPSNRGNQRNLGNKNSLRILLLRLLSFWDCYSKVNLLNLPSGSISFNGKRIKLESKDKKEDSFLIR